MPATWMADARLKVWQYLKVALLCLVIAIAIGIISLPVVFFHLPSEIGSTGSGDIDCSGLVQQSDNCSSVTYSDTILHARDASTTTLLKFVQLCIGVGESSAHVVSGSGIESEENTGLPLARNCSTSQCSEGFYCTVDATFNISICRPQCGSWMQYSRETQLAVDILTIFGGVIGLIAGTASLIIAGIRWRQVLRFPSVFSVYLNISLMIYALLNLISFVERSTVYCSSTDLQESVENPTSFCTFTGVLLHYILIQADIFWFSHVAALFFIIKFPVQARNFKKLQKFKYIHIAIVLAALILPTIPVIVIDTTGGFTLASFPPQLCDGRNPDAVFYSFLFPIIVLSQIGTILLLLMFYIIHKHYGLFYAKQSKNPFKISTAERKILISLCYYLVMSVSAVIASTLFARDANNFEMRLEDYFTCEALQAQDFAPENSCDRSGYLKFTYPEMLAITLMFIELFPAINLLHVVDISKVKQFIGRWSHMYASSSSQLPNTSAFELAKPI